jgi:catecholate siderophore receptor
MGCFCGLHLFRQRTCRWYTNVGSTTAPVYQANPSNGNQVQNVAKNSATLWTTYQVLPDLTLGAGAVAMDKVYGNATNTKWVPGYVRYDAMARYNVNKNVDLQLNVNNLSDKRYFTKAYSSHYATEGRSQCSIVCELQVLKYKKSIV